MLYDLSIRYQKKIAILFLVVFIFSGAEGLRAAVSRSDYRYVDLPSKYKVRPAIAFPSELGGPLKAQSGETEKSNILRAEAVLPGGRISTKTEEDKIIVSGKTSYSGGPGQPEMGAFKSVGTDNMVDPFTGDFSYNIPLLDVGGYPVNIFYNSGITPDQEPSWAGLGWNINPGTIMRNMRGIPDDFNGTDKIEKMQNSKPDRTYGVSAGAGLKFAGFPIPTGSVGGGLNVNAGLSFNNRLGLAIEAGIHPSMSISTRAGDDKTASLSFGANLSASARNGAAVTPSVNLSLQQNLSATESRTASLGVSMTHTSRAGLTGLHLDAGISKSKTVTKNNGEEATRTGSIAELSSNLSYVYPTVVPSIRSIFTRRSYNLSFSVGGEFYGVNGHGRLSGYFTESLIAAKDRIQILPAYGMLHYQKAKQHTNALMDFNRTNDGVYTPNSPAIAMPLYTYDIFSISGEGTGGSFRATRNDLGHVKDGFTKTREEASSLSLDLGFGNAIHGGAEVSYAHTPAEAGGWELNNLAKDVFQFQENAGTKEAVYFKNPGEKTIPDAVYQSNIGGEELVRLKLANVSSGTPMLLPKLVKYDAGQNVTGEQDLTSTNTRRNARDKRTQVISFLTAEEAGLIGFDKKIMSYDASLSATIFGASCNKTGIRSIDRISQGGEETGRQPHHLSEINVLGGDGKKYIYGLPVYNITQTDVSFSIENGNTSTGKSTYSAGTDNTDMNNRGRDGFITKETTPAYAHSFLLTGLVSPNFVDVKGDGITEDDMGDAIKFNYSNFRQGYKWRTPVDAGVNTAGYSQGLKTDPKDDKAHYVYGKREMWYLYSIESKNMVARFFVKNDRQDAKEVLGENGGINTSWGMQRLDKICLYSKGDLRKYGANAKPIKVVRLFHSYKLCPNSPSNTGNGINVNGNPVEPGHASNVNVNKGKLTLDSIWISYNGINKKPKSRYIFSYPSDKNPAYEYNSNDRWGNYKPTANVDNANPGTLDNADYPYSVQDKEKAGNHAASWTLHKIVLPSGGVINVDFEADDYAYVQNKRAASMFTICGFGKTATPTSGEQINLSLYSPGGTTEYDYVYVNITTPITTTNPSEQQRELKARYFADINQLYMKVAAIMPSRPGIAGYEMIGVYADIDSYGMVPGTAGTRIYIRVKKLQNGRTPMIQQVLQFTKQQLPGKAYPGYDVSDNSTAKAVVLALAGMITSVGDLLVGNDNALKGRNIGRQLVVNNSFVRLSNPVLKKYGGGLRVKKVVLSDNWNKMTSEYNATYGQEYRYVDTELVNGNPVQISSGVASWEPGIGSEENPHREIIRYMDRNKGGPYDFGAIEAPLGEAFYPSPLVGYSKVEILPIHRDTVKNQPTRQVSEFFTTRDFPFRSVSTLLSDPQANVKYQPSPIKELLKLDMKKAITQSQGFLIDINDMSGKLRKQATYKSSDAVNPISSTENFYNVKKLADHRYKFNHAFATLNRPDGIVQDNTIIGRDIELMADFRQHKTETITTNISINFDFFVLGIFPVPLNNILQPTIYEGTTYRSASVLKIVNRYGVLDSVVVIDKGSMVSTKNLVYDAETGNPLLTRTNNEHNKPVYNFSYPAHWAYSGMGPAYRNIDAVYNGLTFRNGKLETAIDMSVFESGDELYVRARNNTGPLKQVPCDGPLPGVMTKNNENRVWAVSTGKAGSANPQVVFMDKEGNPYTAMNVSMRIVRSGHRNMLDQVAGSVTTLNSPVNPTTLKLEFDVPGTSVIQSTAASFKDHWRVDNAFYQVDSLVTVKTPIAVNKFTFTPTKNLSLFDHKCFGNSSHQLFPFFNPDYFNSHFKSYGDDSKTKHFAQSWAMFDFSSLPSDANILMAKLNLFAHRNISIPNNQVHSQLFSGNGSSSNCNNAGIQHNAGNPHTEVTKNNFFVMRGKKDWLSNFNNNQWHDFYYNENYIDRTNMVAYLPTYSAIASLACIDNVDKRSDITLMVRQMVSEKDIYPTAIKLSLRSKISSDFGSSNWETQKSAIRVCFEKPTIDVYYTTCQLNLQKGDGEEDPQNEAISGCTVNIPQQYCNTTQRTFFCLSKFTRKAMNPYVEGVLGNWRVDTSFVYYGERKESVASTDVDTRTAGSIQGYKNFWSFSPSSYMTRNYAAKDVWVWNSTITQYNRKGYDVENKDPLNRYNSGLYGYNQHLPVAVVNNSRLREIMFDGFEDYDYETAENCIDCKPRKHVTIQDVQQHITAAQQHTGLKSILLQPNGFIDIKAAVADASQLAEGYGIRIKIDSSLVTDTVVTPAGTGFRGKYYNYTTLPDNCAACAIRAASAFNTGTPVEKNNDNINYPTFVRPPGIDANHFAVRWEGYIQPTVSGDYKFIMAANEGYKFKLTNAAGTVTIANHERWDCGWSTTAPKIVDANNLVKGQLYKLVFDYFEKGGPESAVVNWMVPGSNAWTVIPNSQVYMPGNTGLASVSPQLVYTTTLCTKPDSVQVRGKALTDSLSLVQGRRMVLGAWVKEGGNDCKCSSYVKNNIVVTYTGSSVTETLQPTGNIIEGWQRYESVFTIPATATAIKIRLNNTSGAGNDLVYFDDLRLHPFNANMKSFVYNSSNLRLMSELDENNYSSFYEYDDDGTLTRVKKETINGVKTIQETRSATQNRIQD